MSSPGTQSALSADHIVYSYGSRPVLDDVSLTAKSGEIIGVAGVNGSGKSTLLAVIAGVKRPQSGTLTCYGHDMLREQGQFAKLIGYVPQENPLLPDLTVADNLKLWSGQQVSAQDALLEKLRLSGYLKRRAGKLSGGEKRRLVIACSLLAGQSILVMDEPTAALDLHQKEIIRSYIHDYTGRGGLVIMATHDIMEIEMCDRLYELRDQHMQEASGASVIQNLQDL